MMKNYTKLFAPFVLAFLVGSLTFMFAQTKKESGGRPANSERGDFGAPGFGGGPGGLHPRLLDQLNLTDAQRTQITALQENARTASEALFDQLRTVQEQIRTATQNGAFDEAQLRALLATKASVQIELEILRLKTDAAIYALLTAEQRTLLETLRQQRPEPPRGGGRAGATRN